MKLLSKKGLFYSEAKYFKDWLFELFFQKKPIPKKLEQFSKCNPCRFVVFCGFPQTILLGLYNGFPDELKYIFAPFLIGVVSSYFYMIINPNHEEA